MIPTWRKKPFDDPDWLFDFKYVGFRGLCYLEQGRCRCISGNGNLLSRFEALSEQMAAVLGIGHPCEDRDGRHRNSAHGEVALRRVTTTPTAIR